DEVDVGDVVAHRVALQLADDAQLVGAVDVEGDDGVEAGVGGERLAQRTAVDGEGHRVLAEPVQDARDLALVAEPVRRPAPGGATDGGREGDIHVGSAPGGRVRRGRVRRGRV